MLPSMDEIRQAVRGALLLAQRDPAGMAAFDVTVDGFFKSFFAALLALPFFAVLAARQYDADHPASLSSILVVEGLGYGIGWVAFPVAAIFLTRFYGLGGRYVPLVVAANWAALVQAAIFLGAALIGGLLGGPGGAILLTATVVAVILYEWYVVRTALATTGAIAAGFVAVDLVLSFMINGVTQSLIRG